MLCPKIVIFVIISIAIQIIDFFLSKLSYKVSVNLVN